MLWLASASLLGFAAWVFATRIAPNVSALERALGTTTLYPPLVTLLVSVASWAHAIAAWPLFALSIATATVALFFLGHEERANMREDFAALKERFSAPSTVWVWLLYAAPVVSVAAALLTAWLTEPWAWDALGYHLPLVFDALSEEHFRTVPTHIPYVNAYPDFVDRFVVFQSALQGTWTWLDAAQFAFIPQGLFAGAVMLRRTGIATRFALAWSALFFAVPIVMLELPTNYVDVAVTCTSAAAIAWTTGTLSRATLTFATVALAYWLGAKPSAPPGVVLVTFVLLVRAWQAKKVKTALLALPLLLLGTPKYLANLAQYGNPVWPVRLGVGPFVFPGPTTPNELATMGLREPLLHMSSPMRILYSWFSWAPDHWIYDMRLGGFGPLFIALTLLSAVAIVRVLRNKKLRKRSLATIYAALIVFATSLMSPGAYWARYSLAAPFALLVLAGTLLATERNQPPHNVQRALTVLPATLAAIVGVALAIGGLTQGPSLWQLLQMPAHERRDRVAVDNLESDFARARALIRPQHSFAYDASFGLPGRLVHPSRDRSIVYFPLSMHRDGDGVPHADTYSYEQLHAFVENENVDAIALGLPPHVGATLARAHPEQFRELFTCSDDPSIVFEVLRGRR